jgi:glycosyltransferase involved in cell wall biosynthesis
VRTVVHLIDTGGPGGAETVFLELVSRLPADRWRSVVVVPTEDWLSGALRGVGIEPILLSSEGSYDLDYVRALRRLFREEGADLVHTHLLTSTVYASVVTRLMGIPHVGTFHGLADLDPAGLRRSLKLRLILGGGTHTVFVSRALRDAFLSLTRSSAPRVSVIHNGIDLDRFAAARPAGLREELGLAPGTPLVGAIGNIRASKDYPNLLRATRLLADRGVDFHVAIVGQPDGTLYPELIRLRDELALGDRVTFAEFREDVAGILAELDVFVLSSSSEGFSLSTVEAMAAGIPVVATRSGGPEEIVVAGTTGDLVPPRDPEALAGALAETLGDRARARSMAEAARTAVTERFSREAMLERYDALYSTLTSGAR